MHYFGIVDGMVALIVCYILHILPKSFPGVFLSLGLCNVDMALSVMKIVIGMKDD